MDGRMDGRKDDWMKEYQPNVSFGPLKVMGQKFWTNQSFVYRDCFGVHVCDCTLMPETGACHVGT